MPSLAWRSVLGRTPGARGRGTRRDGPHAMGELGVRSRRLGRALRLMEPGTGWTRRHDVSCVSDMECVLGSANRTRTGLGNL